MNDLAVLWVPLAIAALATLVLLADVGVRTPPRVLGWVVVFGLADLLLATFVIHPTGTAAFGAYEANAWTLGLQRIFLAAGTLAALGAIEDVAKKTPRRHAEYWLMLLWSLAGMSLLAGARDLILLVVSFELMGIPLYVLAAYAKTDAPNKGLAAEAAVKMYLVGATSSAFTLFGLALLTGMTGTTKIAEIGLAPLAPLASLGLVFVLGGIGYKVGAAPFHMWIPDTYQGARMPFVAFLSVAPKAAGIAAIAAIFTRGLAGQHAAWAPAIAVLALLSMTVGNLMALPQTDLRRLLGYSGVAQMGYVLAAMATSWRDGFGASMTLFFLAAYTFTNMGAFLVVHAAAEDGGGFAVDSLAGLSKRSPWLAVALLAFLLSLAGVPFVIGFWAKLYVLLAMWRGGLAWLAVTGIALAIVALFYYLRVLRAAYMVEAEDSSRATSRPAFPLRLAIALCLAAVVIFGLMPSLLVDGAARAADALVLR